MARLRMLRYVGGTHDGLEWPAPGDTVELDNENLIDELLRSKVAELVPEEKPKAAVKKVVPVETAEAVPAENTAKATVKPRARRKGTK